MKTLVLFIHGLGGSEKTWQQFIALAREDAELGESFGFEMFSYATSAFGFGANLSEVALLLRSDLDSKYREYQNIAFIRHSQGGAVAEKYLVEEVKVGKNLRVELVMTYAMPRAGSFLARLAPGTQTKQLRADSDFMRSLNSDWETLEMTKRLKLIRVDGTADAVISQPHVAEFDSRSWKTPKMANRSSIQPASSACSKNMKLERRRFDEQSKLDIGTCASLRTFSTTTRRAFANWRAHRSMMK